MVVRDPPNPSGRVVARVPSSQVIRDPPNPSGRVTQFCDWPAATRVILRAAPIVMATRVLMLVLLLIDESSQRKPSQARCNQPQRRSLGAVLIQSPRLLQTPPRTGSPASRGSREPGPR